ncbi:MAG: tetratricopeptide repeat protein [Planctomycetota bacterium]|nr:MAG: tetratricopeptide repeat protein [Planctomycetota bacterium]
MSKAEAILRKAVPALAKEGEKARRLRSRLFRVADALWKRGPDRLARLGLEVDPGGWRALDPAEPERFAEGVLEVLGTRGALRFWSAVRKELKRKLARKERGKVKDTPPAPKARPQAKSPRRAAEGTRDPLTLSDEAPVPAEVADPAGAISDEGLAVPDDDLALAVPADEGPLAVPGDEDEVPALDLDALELLPQSGTGSSPSSARDAASEEEPADPALGAERALSRYRSTGDREHLARAKKLAKGALEGAEGRVARGAARGLLARVYLLAGQAEKARQLAQRALSDFPAEPVANEVLCKADWPLEAERERLRGLLASAEQALRAGNADDAASAAARLKKLHPQEPFWALVLLARAVEAGEDLEGPLRRAWKLYPPSEDFADLPLGPGLCDPIAKGCLDWLRAALDRDGGDALAQTVRDIESKDNLLAAAFQIPHGVLRTELASEAGAPGGRQQQLRLWIGHTIFHAQHYDHAKDVYAACRRFDRESDLLGEITKSETQCGVMKRSFDKPGVKAKLGKFEGIGAARCRQSLARRLERVRSSLQGDRSALDTEEAQLLESLLADPGRKEKLRRRAKKAGLEDPFAALETLDAASAAPADAGAKKGGLLGRVRAAATKAIDKAKSAVGQGKRKAALAAIGKALRDPPSGGWKDTAVDAFVAKAAAVEPRLHFLESEAERLSKAIARTSDLT